MNNTYQSSDLLIDLDGYEGPLDVLLALARKQKVDLTKLSILQLAEQYLSFIEIIKSIRIEIAADYLVMAAWLAYLKSKLLLPPEEDSDELTGSELAAHLQWQLLRLDSMRKAGNKIMQRNRLGKDIFPRGLPENIKIIRNSVFQLSLYDLLKAYGDFKIRGKRKPYLTPIPVLHSIEDGMTWLKSLIGLELPKWELLESFLPDTLLTVEEKKSGLVATFSASLELVKRGEVKIEQAKSFGPIFIKGNQNLNKNEIT
ncbi:segregation/condensation protein A [Alphaproteobacteria bacterium]|nr:segregation/condensation protein A [Alphaproteobacteria bacterium]